MSTLTNVCMHNCSHTHSHTHIHRGGTASHRVCNPSCTWTLSHLKACLSRKVRVHVLSEGNPTSPTSDPLPHRWYVTCESLCSSPLRQMWWSCAVASSTEGVWGCQLETLQQLSLLEVKLRNKKFVFLMSRNRKLNLHAKAFHGHYLS